MNMDQINYLLTNVDNIKWKPENYDRFINALSSMDLNALDPILQQKAKELLANPREPQNVVVNQVPQSEVQEVVSNSKPAEGAESIKSNTLSKIIAAIGAILMGISLFLPYFYIGDKTTNISSIFYVIGGLVVCAGVLGDNSSLKKAVFILVAAEIYSYFTIADYLNEFQFVKVGLGLISEFAGATLIMISVIVSFLNNNKTK